MLKVHLGVLGYISLQVGSAVDRVDRIVYHAPQALLLVRHNNQQCQKQSEANLTLQPDFCVLG